jgi:hypothetical protein
MLRSWYSSRGDTSVAGLIAVPKHVRALNEVAGIQVNFGPKD